jgi:type II secretory pathway pseudopilin PulG
MIDAIITVVLILIIFSLIGVVIYQNSTNAKTQSDAAAAAAAYASALASQKASEGSNAPVIQEVKVNPDDLYLSQEPLDYKSGWWGTDGTWPNTKYSSKYPEPAGACSLDSSLPLPTTAGTDLYSYCVQGYESNILAGSNFGGSTSNLSILGSNVSDPNLAFYSLTTHM